MERYSVQTRTLDQFEWSDLGRLPENAGGPAGASDEELGTLIRQIERKRRLLGTPQSDWRHTLEFQGRVTLVSFRMEGLPISESEVIEALLRGGVGGDLRSRQAQMIRNHAAILMSIQIRSNRRVPLKPSRVLGWYASLCSGLPTGNITDGAMRRLEQICRQIN